MPGFMGDRKKRELEARRPPQDNNRSNNGNNYNNNSTGFSAAGTIAVQAVQVPLGVHHPQQQQQQQQQAQQARVIVVREHVVGAASNPPVRDNSDVQCCYPITVEDPLEMVYARNIAITHVITEAVGLTICFSRWATTMFFLGVIPSSVVACCCKHRGAYWTWSCLGLLLTVLHAISAIEAPTTPGDYYWFDSDSTFCIMIQVILCGVSMLVVYYGCKTAYALGHPTLPHHHGTQAVEQAGAPMQVPGHLVHGVPLSQVATQQQQQQV